jgi:hypothetical protein
MIMRLKGFALGAAVALAMSAFPATSQAAPLAGSAVDLKSGGSNVEKAAYRECWRRHGRRVCRWVGYRGYDDGYSDYGYYGYGPYYGFGPSIRFGGGHRFHGGGHHRHR